MASTNVHSSLLTTDITFALPWLNPQRPCTVEPILCRPVKLPSSQELAYFSQKHAISVTELVQIAWTVLIEAFCPDESVQVGIHRDDHLIAGNAVDTTSVASILSSLRQILSEVSEQRSKIRSDNSTECFSSIITNTTSEFPLLRKFPIVLNIRGVKGTTLLDLIWYSSDTMDHQGPILAQSLSQAIASILQQPSAAVAEINLCSSEDFARLAAWNESAPAAGPARLVHEFIRDRCISKPDTVAICAWDGRLTYKELDELSENLAVKLCAQGAGPESFIPLYMEKSKWVPVALVAVVKAGAAFVLLDPSLPPQRLHTICDQVQATMVVCSSHLTSQAAGWAPLVITIQPEGQQASLDSNSRAKSKSSAKPINALYAVFTSGSTGKPKCVVVPHRAITAAATAQMELYRLSHDSRVLHYASYAFDLSILEQLYALMAGACLCIPKAEAAKDNLAAMIEQFQINWAFLSPTVARLLSPNEVPSLQHLALGGELVTKADIALWMPTKVHLIIGYGPAECSPCCALNPTIKGPTDAGVIGRGAGAALWVTESRDPTRLMPIGVPGKLLIEGHVVGVGYLRDPEGTTAAFINPPSWLLAHRGPSTSTKLYRTGGLVQFLSDGQIRYLGRRDAQVKLNGQRVELAEVEHQLARAWMDDGAVQVIAEVITPADPGARPVLVALILQKHRTQQDPPSTLWDTHLLATPSAEFDHQASMALDRLRSHLPQYMIPFQLLPLAILPMTPSGKVDRKQLRQCVSQLTRQQLMLASGKKNGLSGRAPITDQQRAILEWTRDVLVLPETWEVTIDDNFFALGGDSVTAMKLAARARKTGAKLQVADIFSHPNLSDLADRVIPSTFPSPVIVLPFSLLSQSKARDEILREAQLQCGVSPDNIEDIYPCTPVQEGMMATSATNPGLYLGRAVFHLPGSLDQARFRVAWQTVVASNEILRTRIIVTPGDQCKMLQVVLRSSPIFWHSTSSIPDSENEAWFGQGQPLVWFAMDGSRLILVLHHAIYDGWSLPLIFSQVDAAYNGQLLPAHPFSPFISFLAQQDRPQLEGFWIHQLQGLSAPSFPPRKWPASTIQPGSWDVESRVVNIRAGIEYQGQITLATSIQLAWGLTLSRYTGSTEVLMGIVSSGRSLPLEKLDQMTGPTIAAMPTRIILDLLQTVGGASHNLQIEYMKKAQFEHLGLRRLRMLGPDCAAASQVRNLLVIQPEKSPLPVTFGTLVEGGFHVGVQEYDWVLECEMGLGSQITVRAHYNTTVITLQESACILDQFISNLTRIRSAETDDTLADVSKISPEGIATIADWNNTILGPVDHCVHEALHHHTFVRPDSPAVLAWDGQLTYQELDLMSTRLAIELVQQHGVGPETFVPLYFEKSKLTVIALVAVIKSGGAFVLLELSHPQKRIELICRQVKAQVLLTSSYLLPKLFQDLPDLKFVVLDDDAMTKSVPRTNIKSHSNPLPSIQPSNALYAVFTSGSTGVPKGTVITHDAFLTNIQHGVPFSIANPSSRMLQFASYAFDASIFEALLTLTTGGCVCIPSEADRVTNLADVVNTFSITTLTLTPSVARTLDATLLPSVQTLLLVGEPMDQSDVAMWADRVQLVNAYGPAECAILSTRQLHITCGSDPANIGTGGCANTWIVDPDDHNTLVPVGAPGELLIEGPFVGRGYLNDPDKTATAFIAPPHWLSRLRGQRKQCLGWVYKTGDLVKYSPTGDGSLLYVGRKDQQVKIHGQRLELGEVESHILQCGLGSVQAVVVEFATFFNGSSGLVAFLHLVLEDTNVLLPEPIDNEVGSANGAIGRINTQFQTCTRSLHRALQGFLPSYMIPSIFVPLRRVPMTTTGKADRKHLHQLAESLPADHWFKPDNDRYASSGQWLPSTEAERVLQQATAEVLGRLVNQAPLDRDFLQLGGDSITSMRLIAKLRRQGIQTLRGPDLLSEVPMVSLAAKMECPLRS